VILRRESSAKTAARFFELKRQRRVRKRAKANRRRLGKIYALAQPARVSVVRAVLPVDIVRSAVWIPVAPVAAALASQPIASIQWPAMPFESNADRLRRYRLAAVAAGNCYTCRCRPVKPGARYCAECIAAAREYRKSIAYEKCAHCGSELNGRKALLCVECMRKNSAHFQRRVADRIASGICGRCGKRPLNPGNGQCVECLDDMRDRILAIGRTEGRQPRTCPVCRELGIDGTGHDRRTHIRWMERRRTWAPEASK
jgi:hypothetical protein